MLTGQFATVDFLEKACSVKAKDKGKKGEKVGISCL